MFQAQSKKMYIVFRAKTEGLTCTQINMVTIEKDITQIQQFECL